MNAKAPIYSDGFHPDIGDLVEITPTYGSPEEATVIRVGKNKIRVQWVAELITGRTEWVDPADPGLEINLIARDYS